MLQELLSKLAGDELLVLIIVIGGLLLAAITIIAAHWRHVRVAEIQAALKRQMIERGMSAGDIEKVLQASTAPNAEEADVQFTGNPGEDKARLVNLLIDNGYEAGDVQRILLAFHDPACAGQEARDIAQKAGALRVLIDNGMESEDIEKVLRGFNGTAEPQAPALQNAERYA